MPYVSPFAPASLPSLPPVAGVRLAAVEAGVRYPNRYDVMLAAFDKGTTSAGALTLSSMPGAPVIWCRKVLSEGHARALIVNSGNANAFTGPEGETVVETIAQAVADELGCTPHEVLAASTGVIGEPLPHARITTALPALHNTLAADQWEPAMRAIMTTDTFPKAATRTAIIGNTTVTLNGIAKGSGMIAPDMATMLSFLFTDASVPANILQDCLRRAVDRSFHCITVDSDTSTSDTVLLFATGKADHPAITQADDPALADFQRALTELCTELAQLVVRDGEGITKYITVRISGAVSDSSARRIGLAIANSPLVKTAIAGEDPNWGRIVMAVGKSGEEADPSRLQIHIGDTLVTENGRRRPDYDEAPVAAYMKGQDITLSVDIGLGDGEATVWTSDLTHEYIRINADYRS